jgi:uncharacterized sulfatase
MDPTSNNSPNQPNFSKPNIILITVDQMRFPMDLPPNPANPSTKLTPDQFVQTYMPNLWGYLWRDGVQFSNYYTAASDCTAARATIHTGLYAYQTYSMLTLITYPPDKPKQPILDPAFPTIGHLMRGAGYETPYFGKWHLSYDTADLEKYGYDSNTPNQDYVGYAGQGYATDHTPAWEAAHWINDYYEAIKTNTDPTWTPTPFFLTLNFVNPHDKQWFWGGIQADDFYEVYKWIPSEIHQIPPGPYIQIPAQADPPNVYNTEDIYAAILNFEDQDRLSHKPAAQTLVKEVFQYQMGGIYEPDEFKQGLYQPVTKPDGFFYAAAPAHPPNSKAVAPERYWVKALNSYTHILGQLDEAIGHFMKSIPEEVRQSAVFVFTSDHGEYGSSHGLQGKGGTVYEEGIRVPLVVRDQSNLYVTGSGQRQQLTSSVDLLPMFATMGWGGTGWMTSDYQQLYGNRCDLLRILREPSAPGRTYALHSTDEFVPTTYNFNDANLHVIGLIQANTDGSNKTKLGVYTTWQPYAKDQPQAIVVNPLSQNPPAYDDLEYYDAQNEVLELISTADTSAGRTAVSTLFGTSTNPGLLSTELQAPLPNQTLRDAQTLAYHELQDYMQLVNELAAGETPTKPTDASSEEVPRRLARAWAL